jgi:3-deoxy-D-manno-octulosonate 8-phosphate phosphatase (KDO 8-P phosphatase)
MALRSRLQSRLVRSRLRQIRLVVCDVDGVLTDGGLHYDETGQVLKRFDVRDGLAVRMLQRSGITVALISGGRSGAIEQRARHLDIEHCRTGVGDKPAALQQLQRQLTFEINQTAFLGDDLNDLAVRPLTGLLVAPKDAVGALRRRADWVLQRSGGEGALREFTDALLASQGHLQALHRHGWRAVNA